MLRFASDASSSAVIPVAFLIFIGRHRTEFDGDFFGSAPGKVNCQVFRKALRGLELDCRQSSSRCGKILRKNSRM